MVVVKNLTNQSFTINTIQYRILKPHQIIEIDVEEYRKNKTIKGLEHNGNIMAYQKQQTITQTIEQPKEVEQIDNKEIKTVTPKKRGRRKKN